MAPKKKAIIAPTYRQALLFCQFEGWDVRYFDILTEPRHLLGRYFDEYEVWWLDGLWPCRTHEDVAYMEDMKRQAKFRGADLHRWWT
jgi:hypothetical protein